MVTVFHYTPVNAKQFDELNIDDLAEKCQKHQNFPRQNFALYGIAMCEDIDYYKLVSYLSLSSPGPLPKCSQRLGFRKAVLTLLWFSCFQSVDVTNEDK